MKGIKPVVKNEKGQVLLFVVVAMTIALALGVGVSLETISTVTSVSDTDTSQRALAAAEGGAENFLSLDSDLLKKLSDAGDTMEERCLGAGFDYDTTSGYGADEDGCLFEFEAVGDDNIPARATVRAESFKYTDTVPVNAYIFNVSQNNMKEVNIEGFSGELDICWNGESGLYSSVYNSSGENYKRLVECVSGSCSDLSGWTISEVDSYDLGARNGYDNCLSSKSSDWPSTSLGLRLRPLGNDAQLAVIPISGDLPPQGYRIVSRGRILTSDDIVVRTVVVFRSESYLPGIFDFALYGGGNID